MSEPKDEPTRGVFEGSDGVLAWLPAVELIGRIPMLELDLEETANAAAEQWQHRDQGEDRWGRPSDLSVGPLG